MSKIEFKPKFFTPWRIVGIGISDVTLLIAAYVIGKKLYDLHQEFPTGVPLSMYILPFGFIMLGFVVQILVLLAITKGKKISIDGNLLSAQTLSLGGKKTTILNLDAIKIIRDKKRMTIMSTGKSIAPIIWFDLIFSSSDEDYDIDLFGWDKGTVKNLLSAIQERFPKIKINTFALRDSSEKISGLDEFMKPESEVKS